MLFNPLMTPYTFVAMIIGIVFAGIVMIVFVTSHYSLKHKKLRYEQENKAGLSRDELADLEEISRRLDKLNKRIEALEILNIERGTKQK